MELKTFNSRTKLLHNFYAPLIHHRDKTCGGVKIRHCNLCKATAFMWGFNLFFFFFFRPTIAPPSSSSAMSDSWHVCEDLCRWFDASCARFIFHTGSQKKQMMDGRNGQEKGWHPAFHLSGVPTAVSFMAEVTLYFYLNIGAWSISYDNRSCSVAERIMHYRMTVTGWMHGLLTTWRLGKWLTAKLRWRFSVWISSCGANTY